MVAGEVERLSTKSGKGGGGGTSPAHSPPQPALATAVTSTKQLQAKSHFPHSVIRNYAAGSRGCAPQLERSVVKNAQTYWPESSITRNDDGYKKRRGGDSAPPCFESPANLNALGARGRSCRRIRLRERAAMRILLGALVNFDRALEVRAVFNHDARRGQIAVHRTVFLDLDPVLRAKAALHGAVHHYLAGNDVGGKLCCSSHRELALIQLD